MTQRRRKSRRVEKPGPARGQAPSSIEAVSSPDEAPPLPDPRTTALRLIAVLAIAMAVVMAFSSFVPYYALPAATLDRVRNVQQAIVWTFGIAGGLTLVALALVRRLPAWVAPTMAVACFIAGVGFYLPFSNDDTFIFCRYARNLAAGHGPVYNLGDRVEGFTSPAWVALLAGIARAGGDPVAGAKVLGVLLGAAAVAGIYACVKRLTRDAAAAMFAAAAFAVSQLFLSWAGSGMDVAIFLTWQVAFFCVVLERRRLDAAVVAVAAVGFLVRPEAYMIAGVVGAWLFAREWPAARGRAVAGAAALAAFATLPVAARWLYFHSLLPNTYYAKSYLFMRGGADYLIDGARYLGWPWVVLGVAGLASQVRREGWLLVCAAVYGGYFLYVGRDVLSFRMLLFAVPLLMIGLGVLTSTVRDLRIRRVLAIAGLGALLVIAVRQMVSAPGQLTGQRGHLYVASNSVGTFQCDYPAGLYLAQHGYPDDVLATDNIGAVSYYGGTRIQDLLGLVNLQPGVGAFRRQSAAEQLLALPPRWLLCSLVPDPAGERWVVSPFGDIRGWAEPLYAPVGRWQSVNGYARVLLERR